MKKKNTDKKIGWVTCDAKRDFVPSDIPLIECLRREFDCEAVPLIWTDEKEIPSDLNWIWVRTPWDYWRDLPGFLAWIARAEKKARVFHSASLITWNADKKYLFELEKKGVKIPPSLIIEETELPEIEKRILDSGWADSVLKPTISAGAENTFRLNPDRLAKLASEIGEARAQSPLLLQKFLPSVATHGEASLIYFKRPTGELHFSHAVLKKTAIGDFRVQEKFGGGVHSYAPPRNQFDFAEKTLGFVEPNWLYARVDLLFSDQEIWLGELEMIEPELFFHHAGTDEVKRAAELIASV